MDGKILTEEQKKEELAKLYAAIGYSENEVITSFPKEYVENKVIVHLKQIGVQLRDDCGSGKPKEIVKFSIKDLYADLAQRPSAQAIRVTAKVDKMKMYGSPGEGGHLPLMVTSQQEKEKGHMALFHAAFETNPLDEKCDQRVEVTSRPLKIVYDANTIDEVMKFFQPPQDVHLQELSAAAMSGLEALKTASKASLAYAVEHHKVTDINLDVMSPYILIPEKGCMQGSKSVLVLDLGHLKIKSDPDQERVITTKNLSMAELESKCYDKFDIRLEQLQVLLAKEGDDWNAARQQTQSKLHIVNPISIDLKLQKALNPDDVRLAQIKLAGSLHSIDVHITDKKLDLAVQLALSIPVPGGDTSQDKPDGKLEDTFKDDRRFVAFEKVPKSAKIAGALETSPGNKDDDDDDDDDDDEEFSTPNGSPVTPKKEVVTKAEMAKQVIVALTFEIEQVQVNVGTVSASGEETPCLLLSLEHLGTALTLHEHDLRLKASIGALALQEMTCGTDAGPLYIIQTPRGAELLSVEVVKAERTSPEFDTMFKRTKLAIAVEFTSLQVLLHQEALLKVMDVASSMVPTIEENQQSIKDKSKEVKTEIKKITHAPVFKKRPRETEDINVDLKAKLGGISLVVTSVKGDLVRVLVGGLSSHISVMEDRTSIDAKMTDLSVVDAKPDVLYPNIVSIVNQEVFSVQIVVYNDAMAGGNFTNMDAVDTSFEMSIGCIRVIFLNKIVMELLAFLDNFQKAKEAMEYARKSATEKAAEKIQDIQSQAARIKLTVSIQAPFIIIPVNSHSRDALVADLGQLVVSNSFKLHSPATKPDGSDAVIVDNMVVELSSVKLSRALIGEGDQIVASSVILEPLNLTIYLARSLSAWYHKIPGIDVTGELCAVKMCTGELDLSTILAVIFQNLGEGQSDIQDEPSVESSGEGAIVPEVGDGSVAVVPSSTPATEVYDTVKFDFKIESVSAVLYWKESTELKDVAVTRDPACCLGQFSIVALSASGNMKSDMSLTAAVSLQSCILDDMRPESKMGVTRMMDRFIGAEGKAANMVDVKFDQSASLSKQITIDVNSVHVVANLEFLLVLANVFTTALTEAPPKPPSVSVETSQALTKVKPSALAPAPPPDKEPPEMRLAFSVKHPEIVLLADAKDKATHALFLKNTLEFNLIMAEGQQKMFGYIKNLNITSAAFDLKNRAATKSQVLYLSQLALHGSAPEGECLRIDVRTSIAQVHVSPATIKTMTACLMSLAPAQGQSDKNNVIDDDVTLWSEKEIDKKSKWYLTPAPKDQLVPGQRVLGRWPKNNSYHLAYVAKIDSRVHLQFDDKDTIAHDVNDIAAVVIDVVPDEKQLKVGSAVIAKDPKAGYYYTRGKITKIDQTQGYHVQYIDGQEAWNPIQQVRVLTLKRQGVKDDEIVPSSIVYVRHKGDCYYPGFIASKLSTRYTVRTYSGDNVNLSIHDTPSVILDKVPRPESIHVGSTVIGSWRDREFWYRGRVIETRKEGEVDEFLVRFEDDDQVWHSVDEIRVVPLAKHDVGEGAIELGSSVWAWWSGINYYNAYVSHKGSKLHVDFYDGDKHLYDVKDAMVTVLPDVDPKPRDLKLGTKVIAKFKKNAKTYFSGQIAEVDKTREDKKIYKVKFDDGDEGWASLYHIRLLPDDAIPGAGGGPQSSQHHIEAGSIDEERGEMLLFSMEGFSIKIEGAYGGQTVPLLSMDGHIQAEVKDWTSKLTASAGLSLIANYYNENVSEWEPLIEPVECQEKNRPWELSAEFKMGDEVGAGENGEEPSAGGLDVNSEPAMSLVLESHDDLQITITKSGLDVFNKLGAAFSEAVSLRGGDMVAIEDMSPFVVRNEIGLGIKVHLGSGLKPPPGHEEKALPVPVGKSLSLYLAEPEKRASFKGVKGDEASDISIAVEVDGYHPIKNIPLKQARVAFYSIVPKQLLRGTTMSAVVQIESGEGQRVITIRSPLQIHNHFPVPMDLCCKQGSEVSKITCIAPHSVYDVPLILSYRAGLFLKPSGFGYNETTSPLLWNDLSQTKKATFTCLSQTNGEPPFYIEAHCEKAVYTVSVGMEANSPVFTFHAYPPVVVHNYLPYSIHFSSQGTPFVNLEGGHNAPLYSVDMGKKVQLHIKLNAYMGMDWKGDIELSRDMDELTTFTLSPTAKDTHLRPVELGVFSQNDGTMNVTLYSPYWMVNKTGMFLEYKASDDDIAIPHADSLKDAVIFSYRGKGNIFAKKTTRVRMSGSEWSGKFSLDTVGSGGSIKIKKDDKDFEIGVQITLSYFSLTKVVEFTPFHLIDNHTEFPVSLCEAPDNSNLIWTTVKPGECIPFWPSRVPPKDLVVRLGDSTRESSRFNFEPDVSILLRMEGKVGALSVEMISKDSAAIMTFCPYYAGAAPIRIENCTDLEICYKQDSEGSTEHVLRPGNCILYTWGRPMDKKVFMWYAKGEDQKNRRITDLIGVGHGAFEVKDKSYFWATFLDGLQRVLLIIDDFTLAYRAQVEVPERISQEISLNLQAIGLSLVNNEKSIEVAYIGITPSQIIWEETKKKGRWKALKMRISEQLEVAYTRVQQVTSVGGEPNFRQKLSDIEVDFELMEIIHPRRRAIRRTFTPGVAVKLIMSAHELELFTKVNSVQIDSQIPGSTFQTVLHPIPPPRSVAMDNAPKPFFEMSVLTRQVEHSHVNEIKYFKVLVQEMETMIDMGFIMALIELFSSDTIDRSKELTQYIEDKKRVLEGLGAANAVQAALSDIRNYFDYFHLSPLKIHVSFSQLGGPASDDKSGGIEIGSSFVNLLMQSVGVAVTEVQDVEFKLAYFEILNQVYNQQQLTGAIIKHYTGQAIKQMYVLVLGLDVLGNPFGLITGLKDGAKDLFYEPYQGLIQGPGEFAEGLALGVRSLVGHTVGGAAGAVSRITGTIGKGFAALSMDEKYQQERRQAMGKKPVNVGEGLARGGKGLLEGVFEGVTGIVTKPVQGAKEQGAAGFFKGLGKGVVGVVARPAGGIVDFASSTFEGIKGSADTATEVKKLRPPRVFYADKVMKPYNSYEAAGNAILSGVKKDKSALEEDKYYAHSILNIKKALVVTNKHIIVAGKAEVFGNWECDWSCDYNDLTAEPEADKNKLVLRVPDKGRVIFKRSEVRAITTPSPPVAQWLVTKIKEARS
ncbi:intermembrane lipid transfer protein VPS13A-like isoform X2 [Nematostella vectensis]|uniref:intermembrane lipid transfer protein VPS13A-like isoform X2 n=1 Tax=Nematostella vectensis TaxID=45351 RepID=UPI0020777462|nr:intermembrane lipid transfer protein VPS13A-like isoform X2 [Nematostella vectensis]